MYPVGLFIIQQSNKSTIPVLITVDFNTKLIAVVS